jgi:hypothetical protein
MATEKENVRVLWWSGGLWACGPVGPGVRVKVALMSEISSQAYFGAGEIAGTSHMATDGVPRGHVRLTSHHKLRSGQGGAQQNDEHQPRV